MAIFKAPRITKDIREKLLLQEAEIVYDVDTKNFYGGDNLSNGGFLIGSSSGFITERISLTNIDIANKFVKLKSTPLMPNNVILLMEQGIPQTNGIDFQIVGDILSWANLGLDNFIDETDVLVVQY